MTTSESPSKEVVDRARSLADELQAPYAERRNRTVKFMHEKWDTEEVAIVGPRDIRLMLEGLKPFYFHPSMALVRLKRLMAGGTDALVTVSGVSEGDTVLDCTAGLCSDSLVFSYKVGERGSVIALEASKVLHAIVREGLQSYETGIPEIDKAMRSIKAVYGNNEQSMTRMEDNSVDIVYFDPMFERPVTTSDSIIPLRSQAHREPLSEESVREAIRIARKKVVLKDHRDSGRFDRLGFRLARSSSSAVAYGVIEIE
ncbi:class I SAM-dependent methyltransferase [Cohnella lupini]|uniref:class I SAM-dependent methyltransferase n=1 Tax=Cohnella lupini TaxID=1294267 RepID=UPI001FE98AA0|nr:class I SAM-dependent methyltransferase [Cohnella lupini]